MPDVHVLTTGAEHTVDAAGRAIGARHRAHLLSARRRPWRWGQAVPALAAALAGALVFTAVSEGGRLVRPAQPLLIELDNLAIAAGLGIDQISLRGHRFTSDRTIFEALQLAGPGSTLSFDSEAARRRIEALPWIASAVIERRLPSGLDVRVVERTPFARWIDDGRTRLIDVSGRVLSDITPGAAQHLPQVSGAEAALHAAALLTALSNHPELAKRLTLAERVGMRRWRLFLDHSLVVELPEGPEDRSLGRLESLQRSVRILDRGLGVVDLRLPDRLGVRKAPGPVSDPIGMLLQRKSINGA